jgi:hypothetical protein
MKHISYALLLLFTLGLGSCLKSTDSLGILADKGSIVTAIFDAEYWGGEKVLSLNATPPSETVELFTIKVFAGKDLKPNADIKATLVENPGAVTAAGLTPLPAGAATFPSLTVNVPKDVNKAAFNMTLNKAALDLSKVYGVAFKLTATSEGVVSELSKEIVVALIIKNAYHADYTVTGFFFHPSAPREIAATKSISTLGAIRCRAQVGDLGGWNFDFDVSGTNVNNWVSNGATPAVPSANFMTADNPGGTDYSASAPFGPGLAPFDQATYGNTYNATTKTFWLHYGYAGGSTGQNGFTRQIYEKWVRK